MTLCTVCKFVKDKSEFDPQFLNKPLEDRICNECCRVQSSRCSSGSSSSQQKPAMPKVGSKLAESCKCQNCNKADAVHQSKKSGLMLCVNCYTHSQKHRIQSVETDVKKKNKQKMEEYTRADSENDASIHTNDKKAMILQDDQDETPHKRSDFDTPPLQSFDG
mmetsp:Transcript_2182/g.7988  ORF Transcript_2182/g.7988 Transcript_2182/m.7988 type:complete len:163 (-) Transcript_2182:1372-1860(-)